MSYIDQTFDEPLPPPVGDRERFERLMAVQVQSIEKLSGALSAVADLARGEARYPAIFEIATATLKEVRQIASNALSSSIQPVGRIAFPDHRFWDCECFSSYIHRSDRHRMCGRCNAYAPDQPDSRRKEMEKPSARCSCLDAPLVVAEAEPEEEKTYAAAA